MPVNCNYFSLFNYSKSYTGKHSVQETLSCDARALWLANEQETSSINSVWRKPHHSLYL